MCYWKSQKDIYQLFQQRTYTKNYTCLKKSTDTEKGNFDLKKEKSKILISAKLLEKSSNLLKLG